MPFKIGEIATGLTKLFKLPLTVGKKTATVNGSPASIASEVPGEVTLVDTPVYGSDVVISVEDLNLDFTSGVLDPRVTFSRTTNATLIGSNGQLQYAPHNLLTYSEQLDDAAWTKVVVTASANVITAPDGTLTAEKLEEVAATNFHMVRQTITVANNTQYTMSAYFNLGERKFVELAPFIGGIGGVSAYFNLETGEITNVAGTNWKVDSTLLTFVGSGWCRCSITFTTGTGGSAFVDYRLAPSSGTNSYAGTLGSGAYMWGAQLNVGALQPYYQTNASAYYGPRFDYDPVTLAPKGLLIEEQRTNSIRNNTMQGAVAGTPGTAPTNWLVVSGGGLSREITAVGSEAGVSYFDIRFFGTGSSVAAQRVYVESSATVAAANGQAWSLSAYVKLVAGTAPSGLFIGFDETGPGTTYIQTDSASLPLTSTLTRNTYSATLSGGVNVAFLLPQIGFNSAIGVAVDFTLRIGLPQLELGAFATSVIPTTTTALTRAADVASVTGANFSSWYNAVEGTLFAEFGPYGNGGATKNLGIVNMDNGTSSNIIRLFAGSTISPVFAVTSSTVTQAYLSSEVIAPTNISKIAGAYKTDNFARSVNGTVASTDSTGTVPVVNRMLLGTGVIGVGELNGHIRSFKYYPTRLSDAELQSLTADQPIVTYTPV
ncbi:hypothetical protein UFOVP562_18 [uncultured Caudovirales phage]|uniref:Uncharacterized protein n=1 Tax=uncultured Caudovirales phage TaxID=2100421 RepID=A0A6J5MW01_9CAUD|nr:hypothetical protein UFOVP562_18 [uncultured Caudovirales phage]